MQVLRSHTDIHDSRLQVHDERAAMYVLSPKGAFQSFLLLTQHLPSSPRLKPHAVPQTMQCTEKEQQKGLFHPLHRSLPVCFWLSVWEGTSACSSPLQAVSSTPPVQSGLCTQRWGPGRATPRQLLRGYQRQDPGAGRGLGRRGSLREPLPVLELPGSPRENACARCESPAGPVVCNVGRGKGLPWGMPHSLGNALQPLKGKKGKRNARFTTGLRGKTPALYGFSGYCTDPGWV